MRDDALPVGRIVFIGGVIAVAVGLAIIAVLAILGERGVPVGGRRVDAPAPLGGDLPMLQSAPQLDLAAYRAEKQRALDDYGWVDAASGVAHVPVALAMDLMLARAASVPARAASGAR